MSRRPLLARLNFGSSGLGSVGLGAVMVLSLLGTGCLEEALHAPRVLAPGLGEARSLAALDSGEVLVASSTGLNQRDGDGQLRSLWEGDARAVSARGERVALLTDRGLRLGSPRAGADVAAWPEEPVTDGVDVLVGCEERVLLLRAQELLELTPGGGEPQPWLTEERGLRGLASTGSCEEVLVFSDHQLLRVSRAGERALILDRQVELRAVALDGLGRTWVIHGTPPRLSLLEGRTLRTSPHYLGDPRDLAFPSEGGGPPSEVYLADGGGTLDRLLLGDTP